MAQYSDIWYDSADLRLKLYARDYGGAGTPVICMHGLSRNSADFEHIAAHLSETYRVISVDQRGRGKSDWDPMPVNYNPAVYVQDMFKLMGDLGIARAVLIGTSMGGIMAMMMGALMTAKMAPQAVIGMVINDVGPVIDVAGLERIKSYIGKSPPIVTWADAAARAKQTNSVAFPDYTDHDWLAFARRTYHAGPDGAPVSSYDPAISGAFDPDQPAVAPPDMWGLWQSLMLVPVLAVRGALSDLLSAETHVQMGDTHPDTRLVTVPNRGHAPMLDEPVALAAIDDFMKTLEAKA